MNDSKPTEEKGKKARKKRRKKNYLVRLLIVLALIAGALIVMHLDRFDINGIAVIGNQRISDEEIETISQIEYGKSIFDVHPLIVQHRIKENLYIEKVDVNRKFPNKVEIIVKEKKYISQLKKDKQYVVIDGEGTVIEVLKKPAEVTLIDRLSVTQAEPGGKIEVEEAEAFDRSLEFIHTAEDRDLFFKKISINGNSIDAYVYDKLKCTGKYKNVLRSVKTGMLRSIIYDLYQKGIEKGTVKVYRNDDCFFTP